MNDDSVRAEMLQAIALQVADMDYERRGNGIDSFRKAVARVKSLRSGALQQSVDETCLSLGEI